MKRINLKLILILAYLLAKHFNFFILAYLLAKKIYLFIL